MRRDVNTIEVSFIIPAKNEEKYIGSCINAIANVVGTLIKYEIIVCDNGSVDNTVAYAEKAGARTFYYPSVNISSLRNNGVLKAEGHILVFLDADVILLEGWISAFLENKDKILTEDIVTGSRCLVPYDPSWIEKYWFAPLATLDDGIYINSGHLVVNHEFFDRIGGFDTSLVTGEDYDFCMRAMEAGGRIVVNSQLRVMHFGYPKTIIQFVKREAWHGTSDFESISKIIHSKVSTLTLIYCVGHAVFFLNTLLDFSVVIPTSIIFLICISASFVKYKHCAKVVPINTVIYYFYFASRTYAFFHSLARWTRGGPVGS